MIPENQRTLTQNASLHKYFELLAKALNEAGFSVQQVVDVPLDSTKETVKQGMFKPVMTAMYPDKTSTGDLNTKEIKIVYDNLDRFTSEQFGISIPWPSNEPPMIGGE